MNSNMVSGSSERYRQLVDNIDNLPPFPAIVNRLIEVINSPESSADDAAKLLEKDPALTSKIIRLANSAFYGIPRSISSVSTAVVILGFNAVRSIVLSVSLMKMFPVIKNRAFDRDRFWKHSIVTALASRIIVRHFFNVRIMDPESAFCAGILHDIGKLIFCEYMSREYLEVCEYARENKIALLDAEKRVLGFSHAELGKILAEKWALPSDLGHAIIYHHNPGDAHELVDLVTTVHIADLFAHESGNGLWEEEVSPGEWEQARTVLKLSEADYRKVNETLAQNMEKSSEFFSIIK
ncbi:MAG: HDOD domain-containing protein [Fibrobacter sp.]|nr:HDOD domain-containing protein [Fibrobacter sp.]